MAMEKLRGFNPFQFDLSILLAKKTIINYIRTLFLLRVDAILYIRWSKL